MELGHFDEAAHILTDLLIDIFDRAEKQQYSTKWEFAQLVYARFLQLSYLLNNGKWTCDARSSWAVRLFTVFTKIVSDPISFFPYDDMRWIHPVSKGR
jgi:hypothetical protein